MLEHESDVAFLHRKARDVVVAEDHLAAVGKLEAGDEAQERGLAGPRRPEQRQQFSRTDIEADVAQHVRRVEDLGKGT